LRSLDEADSLYRVHRVVPESSSLFQRLLQDFGDAIPLNAKNAMLDGTIAGIGAALALTAA
jgi:hypothetical protein